MITQNPNQGNLFNPPRHKTAATSRAAHRAIKPKINPRKQEIIRLLRSAGPSGLTRAEISDATELPEKTVCPLVRAMLDGGTLIEPGSHRTTESGNAAKVVVLAEYRIAAELIAKGVSR